MAGAFVTGGSGFLGGALIRALRRDGIPVRALARSDGAAGVIRALDAEAVRGDLGDIAALAAGMQGAEVVYHAAALAKEWGTRCDFVAANVEGTANVLEAARVSGVRRVIHVSTEAVLADGNPIVRADETRPPADAPVGLYAETKKLAELEIARAVERGLDVVIVRPRLIWGKGDTTLLPIVIKAVREGKFAWIDGGHYLTSTCHVDNVVHGLLCAKDRGKRGEVYYLTDGEPIEFRRFVEDLLRAARVDPGTRSIPKWLASGIACASEAWAKLSSGTPSVTRMAIALSAHEVTVVDDKARREIGYAPGVGYEQGLRELV